MMIGDEEYTDRDFFIIKDKAERLKTKRQLQIDQIIKNAPHLLPLLPQKLHFHHILNSLLAKV